MLNAISAIVAQSQPFSDGSMEAGVPLFILVALAVVVFILFAWLIPIRLWIAAWASGAHVGLFTLVAM